MLTQQKNYTSYTQFSCKNIVIWQVRLRLWQFDQSSFLCRMGSHHRGTRCHSHYPDDPDRGEGELQKLTGSPNVDPPRYYKIPYLRWSSYLFLSTFMSFVYGNLLFIDKSFDRIHLWNILAKGSVRDLQNTIIKIKTTIMKSVILSITIALVTMLFCSC